MESCGATQAQWHWSLFIVALWCCLDDTPFYQKHLLFAQFFPTLYELESVASGASIVFAAGLFEVLMSTTSPAPHFFKTLPTNFSSRWAIYVIVLEKGLSRPRVYIGSGTSTSGGVRGRLQQYDDGLCIPKFVQSSLDEGFEMVHKGLLCWIPIPPPALVPTYRLLFVALEATFTYMFWTMKATKGDYGMGHMCLWDRTTLAYDGLCSHCSLNEGIRGDFDLSAEELEALAVVKEEKRLLIKAENATNWHFKQMETNYDDYIGYNVERKARWRAENPGHDAAVQARRIEEARAALTFHCVPCDLSYGTKNSLDIHLASAMHSRKLQETEDTPFKCGPCNKAFANQQNLNRHLPTARHKANVAAALPSPALG